MDRMKAKAKSTRDHLDAIFNARNVLSFVGEAIGKSSDEFSESANVGVFLIMEHLCDDLEDAATALTAALQRDPSGLEHLGVTPGCATGVEGRVSN